MKLVQKIWISTGTFDYFLEFYYLRFATPTFMVSGAILIFEGIIHEYSFYNKYFKNRKRKVVLFLLIGLSVWLIPYLPHI